jgi:helix-turn-helix protein
MEEPNIKSLTSVNGKKEVTLKVKKITNGYILTKETYIPSSKTKDGKYIDSKWETEETYSEVNPLAKSSKTLAEIFTT